MGVGQVKLSIVDRAGAETEVAAATGDVLMEVLRDNIDFGIGVCGGVMSCGTCRVFVDASWRDAIPTASEPEIEMLDMLGDEAAARLACQIKLDETLNGLRVTIAPAQ